MTAKRIFVLNGHPAETSLSRAFAQTYAQAAQAVGHDVRTTHLHDLDFDMDFGFAGYSKHKPLEPCLEDFQADMEWAHHIVLTTPMWWGGLPAKLKGLIDRTFLPGWAYNTRKLKRGMPTPMLNGKNGPRHCNRGYAGLFLWAVLWQSFVAPNQRANFPLCRDKACSNYVFRARHKGQCGQSRPLDEDGRSNGNARHLRLKPRHYPQHCGI